MTVFGHPTEQGELWDGARKLRRLAEVMAESQKTLGSVRTKLAFKETFLCRQAAGLEEEVKRLDWPVRSLLSGLEDYLRRNLPSDGR